MANGRVAFDGAPAELTDAAAQELYGIEANEAVGCCFPRRARGRSPPRLPPEAAIVLPQRRSS